MLTRAHDAAAAQLREEEGEVIDLTSRRAEPALACAGAGAEAQAPATAAPLARVLSSPLVGARAPATGLAYDALMLKHGYARLSYSPRHRHRRFFNLNVLTRIRIAPAIYIFAGAKRQAEAYAKIILTTCTIFPPNFWSFYPGPGTNYKYVY